MGRAVTPVPQVGTLPDEKQGDNPGTDHAHPPSRRGLLSGGSRLEDISQAGHHQVPRRGVLLMELRQETHLHRRASCHSRFVN